MDIDDVRDALKLNNMADIIRNAQDSEVTVLAALTSGEGSNVLGENLSSFFSLIKICGEVEFLPFSDREVELYMSLHDIQFNFECDLKHLTGYNPLLLAQAASLPNLSWNRGISCCNKFCSEKLKMRRKITRIISEIPDTQ